MNPRQLLLLSLLSIGIGVSAHAQSTKAKRFQFREPRQKAYVIDQAQKLTGLEKADWVKAHPENDPESTVEISSRLVVQVKDANELKALLVGTSLEISRQIAPDAFVLQAADAMTAMAEAERLAKLPEVKAAAPVMRRDLKRHSFLAPEPNDPSFSEQWNLEQRDESGNPLGIDLNIRSAWSQTTGSGLVIGIADDGVELSHADLVARGESSLHYNFGNSSTNGGATGNTDVHATAVAGLAVATMNNGQGGVGVAPGAKFASWKIFDGSTVIADDVALGNVYQFANNSVAVQNHSWGHNSSTLNEPSLPEKFAIDTATTSGRDGKGIVMVRSVPDRRALLGNANDDGYPNHPGVIAVAGLLANGRVAGYSDPGACILVGAPGGEFGSPTLFSTDRTGTIGYNTASSPAGDYSKVSGQGQSGTSFAAPQIAGLAALMLSVNSNLTSRDVQQILIQSARHVDLSDPHLTTNGAGFAVSHNAGFGVPDAGKAVSLARNWPNRPALTTITVGCDETAVEALDDGLRVVVPGMTNGFDSIAARPSTGLQPDAPTDLLPLVDVGMGTNITVDLTGKGALMVRGGTFSTKVNNAAQAGAAFAIIYDNTNSAAPRVINTEFSPIPAVFISKTAGEALTNYMQANSASARLQSFGATTTFSVTDSLLCEHVAVSVEIMSRRGDVRLVLTSPSGTKSILQRISNDTNTLGLVVWTYTSTQHFYENSAGVWTLTAIDEAAGQETILQTASLKIYGVPITDSDHDGLSDEWENANFSNLSQGAQGDPDGDGISNMHEQIIGGNPTVDGHPMIVEQPEDATVPSGATVVLSVEATGVESLVYQWRFNGGEIAGATQSSLTLTNVQVSHSGDYSVDVGNWLGNTNSAAATVTVFDSNVSSSLAGMSLTLSVTNGSGAFTSSGNFLFVAAATNNSYRLIELPGGTNVTSDTYVYSTTLENGLLELGSATYVLTFTSGGLGHFVATNLSGDGQSGSFALLPSGPDFNNDGRTDLIFQHSNGVLATWYMRGSAFQSTGLFRGGQPAGLGWRMIGAGDLNGDGQSDLLFQHTNGKLAVWFMNGTAMLSSQILRNGTAAAAGWKAVATGDFNGDRQTDILFQHTGGQLAVWYFNGSTFLSVSLLRNGQPIAAGWKTVAVGDFNGDAKEDILFQHDTGMLAVWNMNRQNFINSEVLRNGLAAGQGWRAQAIADFNGDGRNDVIFQHTSGTMAVWHMNGKTFMSSLLLRNGQAMAPGWLLSAPK